MIAVTGNFFSSAAGRRLVGAVLAVCVLGAAAVAVGQYQRAAQINPQVNQGAYQGINNASPAYGSVRYASQMPGQNPVNNPMLGSQVRQMNYMSGNLPSQIRYSGVAAGPGSPVPMQTPQSAAAFAGASKPSAPVSTTQMPSGSVRYSSASRSMAPGQVNTQVSAKAVGSGAIPAAAVPAAPAMPASVRYSTAMAPK